MFYTPVNIIPPTKKISLNDPVLTAGSCFADCMGSKFKDHKFLILKNPFGTVYNPLSLQQQYLNSLNNKPIEEDKFIESQGLYFHYYYHSSFKGKSRQELINALQTTQRKVHDYLKTTKWFIITWGTAWVYEKENEVVANCHKQPQTIFTKRLLDQQTIQNEFGEFLKVLKLFNPSINIILTISPVRHIRDTLSLNMVSKSILRTAAHYISENHPEVYYFPAYEIMIDELRDYRFYKEDMIHPTAQAEELIWKRFSEVCLTDDTRDFISQWEEIRRALAHRPFNQESGSHQKFLRNTLKKLEQMSGKVDVSSEAEAIKKQLI